MANNNIKIIINLRQLERGDKCGSSAGSSNCVCEDPSEPKRDPKIALEAARQLGRTCGGAGGCTDVTQEMPTIKQEPCCSAPPAPPPPRACCPAMKETLCCSAPAPLPPNACCPAKNEEPCCGAPVPPPPKARCPKKVPTPPQQVCPTKEFSPLPPPPPPKREACVPKKEPVVPPKVECAPKIEPPKIEPPKIEPPKIEPPKKEEPPPKLEPEPKKCTQPKYLNADVRPNGKVQQCKEGTSADGKCRHLNQQRERGDDWPNPASSGGMVQFFKDRFYDAADRSYFLK